MLMRIVVRAALAAIVLAECLTAEERRYARINDAAASCTAVGFTRGTQEHTSCTAQIYKANEVRRQQDTAELTPLVIVL
jgi:hypothetical protein